MSYPINKKEVYSARYPKGTIVELTEPIDDEYSPKPVGSRFKVLYIITLNLSCSIMIAILPDCGGNQCPCR